MAMTDTARRFAPAIQWSSIGLIVLSLFVISRSLPFDTLIGALRGWIEGIGVWGPVIFGLIYVAATVLFIPGLILTIAAGAIFGLLWGTVVVSLSSTTGAALAFLVGRYLARDKVAEMAEKSPRFGAVDGAVEEGGWKIVALLRLSPAIPFNLQNYLYGLTPIGFWPCVLTSWVAMLPGTFMYVYVGHVTGLVVGGERERTLGEWVLLGVGLAATVVVTFYVTRLASRQLNRRTELDEAEEAEESEAAEEAEEPVAGWPWGATVAALLAALSVAGAVWAQQNPDAIRDAVEGLAGPPSAKLEESYDPAPDDAATFDHSTWDELVAAHVEPGGWLDYDGFAGDAERLDRYLEAVAEAPFEKLGRNEKLALLINAYNAFTVRLILDHRPLESIQDIPEEERWRARRWRIGGKTVSLDQLEHEEIRPHFEEPRIHFALVCAAVGCPPLRTEAYAAERLDEQLEDQARTVHSNDAWFRFDAEAGVAHLTKLYDWYAGDFEQVAGAVLDYAARYSPKLRQALDAGAEPEVEWIPYDWSLNSVGNRGERLGGG